jgi:hypothetical protein
VHSESMQKWPSPHCPSSLQDVVHNMLPSLTV